MHLKLRQVGQHDWQFLYDLLAERPKIANISHQDMPSLAEHTAFVRAHPYYAWYIIEHDHESAGACYLTKQDEIGIQVSKAKQEHGIGSWAIDEIMRLHPKPRYLANIAPNNWRSHNMFIGKGLSPDPEHIRAQSMTYEKLMKSIEDYKEMAAHQAQHERDAAAHHVAFNEAWLEVVEKAYPKPETDQQKQDRLWKAVQEASQN